MDEIPFGAEVRTLIYMLILILSILLLASCEYEPEHNSPEYYWLAISNIDGSETRYIRECYGGAYFVPDPENPGQELILANTNWQFTLLDTSGTVRDRLQELDRGIDDAKLQFSEDRSKFVFAMEGDIYLYNLPMHSLTNITDSDSWDYEPTLSPSGEQVLYVTNNSDQNTRQLILRHIESGEMGPIFETDYQDCGISDGVFVNESGVCFTFREYNSLTAVCKIDFQTGQCDTLRSFSSAGQLAYNDDRNELAVWGYPLITIIDLNAPHLTYLYDRYISDSRMNLSRDGKYLSTQDNVYNLETLDRYPVDSHSWIDFSRDGSHILWNTELDYYPRKSRITE